MACTTVERCGGIFSIHTKAMTCKTCLARLFTYVHKIKIKEIKKKYKIKKKKKKNSTINICHHDK